jgi:hypothetical protein
MGLATSKEQSGLDVGDKSIQLTNQKNISRLDFFLSFLINAKKEKATFILVRFTSNQNLSTHQMEFRHFHTEVKIFIEFDFATDTGEQLKNLLSYCCDASLCSA